MKDIRVASFFAGAGGLDLGFRAAGYNVVYASDIDPDCCQTLQLNHGSKCESPLDVVCGDIRAIELSSLPNNVDLVIGGPPCQSFSASGRRAGGAAGRLDDRGNLFEAYCKVIAHLNPQAFVFENVRGILATNKGEDWRAICSAFESLGYFVNYRLLDAADYGIPQHRERIFLVGHKLERPFLFPRPTYGPDSALKRSHISPREAFSGLRVSNMEADHLRLSGGKYSHLLPDVPPGQNYLFFTSKRGHPKPVFAYRSRFSDFLYKAHPDYPMKTIIASPGKYTGPLHWDNRYFSIDEYKAIQGFPKDYQFSGDRASIVRQIGNSVSPKVAKKLALSISGQVFGQEHLVELLGEGERLSFDKRKGSQAAKTRAKHQRIEQSSSGASLISMANSRFRFSVLPGCDADSSSDVVGSSVRGNHSLEVFYQKGASKTAEIDLQFWGKARAFSDPAIANLTVHLYGSGKSAPQAMWNAVDEWVREVSSFGSLFELYGHFTEPHPFFQVKRFEVLTDDPMLTFAKYFSDFRRCSNYRDKKELMTELAEVFGVADFDGLASDLRKLRYDVRTRETNIAIPPDKYMVAYPFTLPHTKQMNFSVKRMSNLRVSESYVTEKRLAS